MVHKIQKSGASCLGNTYNLKSLPQALVIFFFKVGFPNQIEQVELK